MPGRTMTPLRSPLTYTVRVAASQSSSIPCTTARAECERQRENQGGLGQPHHHVALLELRFALRSPLPLHTTVIVPQLAVAGIEHPAMWGLVRTAPITRGVGIKAGPNHADVDTPSCLSVLPAGAEGGVVPATAHLMPVAHHDRGVALDKCGGLA